MNTILSLLLAGGLVATVLKLLGVVTWTWAAALTPIFLWVLVPVALISCATWFLYEFFKR